MCCVQQQGDRGNRKRYMPSDKDRPGSPLSKRMAMSPGRGRDRRMPGRPMFPPRMDRPRGPGPRPMPPQGDRLVESRSGESGLPCKPTLKVTQCSSSTFLRRESSEAHTAIPLTQRRLKGEPCQDFLAVEVLRFRPACCVILICQQARFVHLFRNL